MEFETVEVIWILIVDDDKEIRASVRELLEKCLKLNKEVRFQFAQDGAEATAKISQQKFDCILTDLSMPKKEGVAFISSVRRNLLNEHTPIIVLSGRLDSHNLDGFNYLLVLPKPFDPLQLVQLVTNQIKVKTNKAKIPVVGINLVLENLNSYFENSFDQVHLSDNQIFLKEKGKRLECKFIVRRLFNDGLGFRLLAIATDHELSEIDPNEDRTIYEFCADALNLNDKSRINENSSKQLMLEKFGLEGFMGVLYQCKINDFEFSIFTSSLLTKNHAA